MPGAQSRSLNLDLDLLRTFVVVAEARSFTRAGQRVGRSQSAVSLQIRRLEEALGVSLFTRDPRRVVLTAEGEALLPQARALMEALLPALAEGADELTRAELSARLAEAPWAPPSLLAELAREPLEVSRPLLARSRALDTESLRLAAREGGPEMHLVLARRPGVAPAASRDETISQAVMPRPRTIPAARRRVPVTRPLPSTDTP